MNALVISGGGSKGAFAGGVAEYLIKNKGKGNLNSAILPTSLRCEIVF